MLFAKVTGHDWDIINGFGFREALGLCLFEPYAGFVKCSRGLDRVFTRLVREVRGFYSFIKLQFCFLRVLVRVS